MAVEKQGLPQLSLLSMWREKYKELFPVALKMWGLSKVCFSHLPCVCGSAQLFLALFKKSVKTFQARGWERVLSELGNFDEKLSYTLLPLTHNWNSPSSIISQTTNPQWHHHHLWLSERGAADINTAPCNAGRFQNTVCNYHLLDMLVENRWGRSCYWMYY